jgi:hypothetical protein
MSDQITYDDKADLIVDTTIDDIFKVSASDMNEIKNVVNSHADDIDVANNNITDLNNNKLDADAVLNQASTDTDKPYSADYLNDKLVSVGATAPENGERVWFKKGKNLLNLNRAEVTYSVGIVLNESNMYSNMAYDGGVGTANTQNVVDGETLKVTSRYSQGVGLPIKCKPNEQYSLTLSNTNNLGSVCILFFDENNTYLSNSGNSHTETLIVTTPSNCKWLVVLFDVTGGTKTEISFSNIQLEQGSTATTYEPYIEKSINVDEEEWYSKPKVLWSGKETSVSVDLRGYSFIEVIFCSNDNYYNSLKVSVERDTFTRILGLCNNYLSYPMGTNGVMYLKYGKAVLTQSGITIQSNAQVTIPSTASQIQWTGAGNKLLYITTIIGYK